MLNKTTNKGLSGTLLACGVHCNSSKGRPIAPLAKMGMGNVAGLGVVIFINKNNPPHTTPAKASLPKG
jgi:hypothetical protein